MENMVINLSLFGAGMTAGLFIGYTLGKMEKKSMNNSEPVNDLESFTVQRKCDVLSKYATSMIEKLLDIKVVYKGSKILTNNCPSLIGKKCKHTNKECHFL